MSLMLKLFVANILLSCCKCKEKLFHTHRPATLKILLSKLCVTICYDLNALATGLLVHSRQCILYSDSKMLW